ncbi:MAG TPA: hypothetical protein VOB72_10310 [Candidatus Dormibacteraeota bacterium]|nr:hypothetical protein [Candidatus Dormibacteraeota bacterium]
MRLSLSVPDALWLRACEACPDTPPSRLVQAALEHLLADAETGYVPGPPAGAGARVRRLERRLRSEARSAYEEGYETGLDLADVLEWWALERLAAVGWRADRLAMAGTADPVLEELRAHLTERDRPAAQRLAAELGQGQAGDVRRAATFVDGLLAALRDCAADVPMPAV